jgi:hypothetical protein
VRDREPRAVELAGEVDRDAAVPFGRVDLLDAPGRPAMPALFTRQSRPPSFARPSSKKRATWARSDTSHTLLDSAGSLARTRPRRFRVGVADVHACALVGEGPRDREPDARPARRDHHAQSTDLHVHLYSPPKVGLEQTIHEEEDMTSRRTVIKGALAGAATTGLSGFPFISYGQSDVIRIGHLTPRTGFLGTLGEFAVQAADMAVDEINKAGGVNGRKIELLKETRSTRRPLPPRPSA